MALAAWQTANSYGQATAILTERGIRTPGGGEWTRAAVRSLIQRHAAQLGLRELRRVADFPPTEAPQVTL